jgi:hypothetical protein
MKSLILTLLFLDAYSLLGLYVNGRRIFPYEWAVKQLGSVIKNMNFRSTDYIIKNHPAALEQMHPG